MNTNSSQTFRTFLSSSLRICLALGPLAVAIALGAACGDDDDDSTNTGGKGGSSGAGGASGTGGSSGASGTGGSSGTGGGGGAGGGAGASGAGGGAAVNPIEGAGTPAKIVTAHKFTEGPLWVNSASKLLFTDVQANTVYSWTEGATEATPYLEKSNGSNGLALLPDGRIARCSHGDHDVVVHTLGDPGTETVVAADFDGGKRLNSPNDVIADKSGRLYFTDPTFGLGGATSELGFQGVYRAVPNGAKFDVTVEDNSLQQPNGVALSPDEKKLYVADTGASIIRSYQVGAEGVLSLPTKFSDTGGGGDGVTVDDAGNVYVAMSAGVRVFAPDGTPWGTLAFAEQPSNVAFGGPDRKTLYVTARTSVYRVTLANAAGNP